MNKSNLRNSLKDIVIVEIGDQSGEYASLLMAGLGAHVIKLESPQGSPSRDIGPFASATPDPEQSIFFWRYNLNKKSVALDLDHPAAREPLRRILAKADIVLIAGAAQKVQSHIERCRELAHDNARLIICAMTPFGLDGPYRDFEATDLTQMALGGIMPMCGYDPAEDLSYSTPPINPGMWQSYHIGGEYAAISMMAALNFRDSSGEGQFIDLSVHEAVNTCTEGAMPMYIYNGQPLYRQTARHAMPARTQDRLLASADKVYMQATITPFEREERALGKLLDQLGIEHILGAPEYAELKKAEPMAAFGYRNDLIEQVIAQGNSEELFVRAQSLGLAWSPIRRPEDNLKDPHLTARGTFVEIHHPELGRNLKYPGTVAVDGKDAHMHYSQRAPRLGEHTESVLQWAGFGEQDIASMRRQHLI